MRNEKRSIFKSISIIGSGQILSIISGMLRVKVIAITLGTSGLGLFALFQSILDLFKTIFSFGLNLTVSREAAVVVNNKGDLNYLWSKVFSWIAIGSILSSIFLLLYYLFQDYFYLSYKINIVNFLIFVPLFGFSIFYTIAQSFIQGGLGYKTYIKISILSSVIGSFCSILVILIFKEEGVLLSILVFWFVGVIITCYFINKSLKISIFEFKADFNDSKKMIFDGGFVLLATGSNALNLLLIRDMIVQDFNEEGLGLVQAGLSISIVYISLVISSLASDYYPKLSTYAQDKQKAIELVNNQTEILLFIGVLMMLGIGYFLNSILIILYSSEFLGALNLTYWLVMSTFFRLLGYPLSYVALVRNEGYYYFLIEFVFNLAFFLIVYFFISKVGIEIVGIGVFFSYFLYSILNYIYCFREGFVSYSLKLVLKIIVSFLVVFSSFYVLRFDFFIEDLLFFISLFAIIILINFKLVFKDILRII